MKKTRIIMGASIAILAIASAFTTAKHRTTNRYAKTLLGSSPCTLIFPSDCTGAANNVCTVITTSTSIAHHYSLFTSRTEGENKTCGQILKTGN